MNHLNDNSIYIILRSCVALRCRPMHIFHWNVSFMRRDDARHAYSQMWNVIIAHIVRSMIQQSIDEINWKFLNFSNWIKREIEKTSSQVHGMLTVLIYFWLRFFFLASNHVSFAWFQNVASQHWSMPHLLYHIIFEISTIVCLTDWVHISEFFCSPYAYNLDLCILFSWCVCVFFVNSNQIQNEIFWNGFLECVFIAVVVRRFPSIHLSISCYWCYIVILCKLLWVEYKFGFYGFTRMFIVCVFSVSIVIIVAANVE